MFIFYFVTECPPLLTLVGLIWRVPKKQARSFSRDVTDTRFPSYLQRGSTKGSTNNSETAFDDIPSDGSDLSLPSPSRSVGGSTHEDNPRDNGPGAEGDLGSPLLDSNVFEDMSRYDSPPTGSGHLSSNTGGGGKFAVGSYTSSNDPRQHFSNIQAR